MESDLPRAALETRETSAFSSSLDSESDAELTGCRLLRAWDATPGHARPNSRR